MRSLLPAAHYELQAYICGKACSRPSPFEGWATFEQIFNARPDGCRYAVVRRVPLRNHNGKIIVGPPAGDFLVWDLYHDDIVQHQWPWRPVLLQPPEPTWTGRTADGMVMKAMALYVEP